MSDSQVKRPARSGFTLLEVLVAVALLGVVVSVLARSAIEGMAYEGDAGRRTRASLLADRALFQVEASLELGPPKALHEESQEGEEFRVTLDVQPIELGPGGLDALLGAPEEKQGTGKRGGAAAKAPSVGLSLYRVLVNVSWFEGLHAQSVTRSSFAYDASAAAQALGSEDEEKPPPPPAEEEP